MFNVSILGLMDLGFRHLLAKLGLRNDKVSILGLMDLGFRQGYSEQEALSIRKFQSLV